MINKDSFSSDYIKSLQTKYSLDPALLERVVYAFGLLEAFKKVEMPFIFKGGTCLILLLDKPMRLSTDIDIIVNPLLNVDKYIEKISDIFPFKSFEEQKRKGKNNIEKRHFKFIYESPITKKEIYILLDILFEDNNYQLLLEKEINNDLLKTEGDNYTVFVPSIDCILADKLTAFAPHTIGIPVNKNKDMEVMKQMFDICTLVDYISSFEDFIESYEKIAKQEIEYCGIPIGINNVLEDTITVSKKYSCFGSL